jgi:hypothetical protein
VKVPALQAMGGRVVDAWGGGGVPRWGTPAPEAAVSLNLKPAPDADDTAAPPDTSAGVPPVPRPLLLA